MTTWRLSGKVECFDDAEKCSFTIIRPQGQSPTAKISPVETNPENTHSHKMAHISSSRDD